MLARFVKNCRGGVAPLLALTIIPLMGAVGVAIDFSRINAARTSMQSALDSTALMLSKTAANDTIDQLNTSASTYFNAVLTNRDVLNPSIAASYSSAGGSRVNLSAHAMVKTDFLGVLGFTQVPIGATATSVWGDTRLRVALVLDNTGSMADDGKITALKTAANNLLNSLHAVATGPDDIYVSIVPFSKDVNLGSANYAQPWLTWDLWDAANGTCSGARKHSQSSCQANGGTWTPASHSTWNGCVTDRDQNFDTTNDPPLAGGPLYPAEQYSYCPAATLGLSNDWTALASKISDMQPNGNTNQAIGLQVGWQSLTASPFTVPALDPNYKYQQVIILLTDGLNTQDRWYSYASQIDARQQITCNNIKAAGITIYTVQVDTGGDPVSTLLQNCASDSSKFFLLTTSDQIVTTFDQIGTSLTKLRLAS